MSDILVVQHVSGNTTKQKQQLLLTLLCTHRKKITCQVTPHKKDIRFSYVAELLMLVKVVVLQNGTKPSVWIRCYHKTSIFSCLALITVEHGLQGSISILVRTSERICCLSDNFVASPYAVSALRDSLQQFFSRLQSFVCHTSSEVA